LLNFCDSAHKIYLFKWNYFPAVVKTFGRLLELACGHDLIDERIKNTAFIELIVTTEQCTSFAS
jgi:hypothetical protein